MHIPLLVSRTAKAPATSSSRRRHLGWLLCLIAVLGAPPLLADDLVYTVRPGDNLWNLAKHHLKDLSYYRKLQAYNRIEQPRHLKPGSILKIPIEWLVRNPAPARVIKVKGQAELIRRGGGRKTPEPGDTLTTGDTIRTGMDGSISLRMADDSQIIVQSNTELKMDTLSAYGINGMVDTRMRMQHGRVDAKVPTIRNPASRYEITTPAAVAAVRGTGFRVSADADAPKARTEVLQGTVAVSGASVTRRVPHGFGTLAEAGKPPLKPRPLLPPPDLSGIPQRVRHWPFTLQWNAVAGAVDYRLQISGSPTFETLTLDKRLPRPRLDLPRLEDGSYHLRVRAIDDLGLEGIDATRPLVIDIAPLPPEPLGISGGLREGEHPRFAWKPAPMAARYHLQVARSNAFSHPVLNEKALTATEFQGADPLPPGHYVWRVAAIDAKGKEGPFSRIADLTVRPLPAPPEPTETKVKDDTLTITWPAAAEPTRYRIQLARSKDFSDLLLDQTLDTPRVKVPGLPAGTVFYRIQPIDASGAIGPFGATHTAVIPSGFYWPIALLLIAPLFLLITRRG